MWTLLAYWGLYCWRDEFPLGFLLAVAFGVTAAIWHVHLNYDEIACTCDDPDHDH